MARMPTLLVLACVVAAAVTLWVTAREVRGPAPAVAPSREALAAAAEPAAREAAAPRGEEAVTREVVDSAPGLDDFAPEQREAVREILAMGMPGADEVAAVRAAIEQLEEDDAVRRVAMHRWMLASLLGSSAIVRCDVVAVSDRTVTIICRSLAREVELEPGQRRTFPLASTRAQREVLQRHGLADRAAVVAGRVQTLLLGHDRARFQEVACVLAGPARGNVVMPDAPPVPTVDDFEPAFRGAVRELIEGRSPWTSSKRLLGASTCVLVRCKVERGLWGTTSYRSLVELPGLAIDQDEVFEVMANRQPDVAQHYGLPPQGAPQPGEERTLVVWNVDPFGFGLYKRWLLLASPPLPSTAR